MSDDDVDPLPLRPRRYDSAAGKDFAAYSAALAEQQAADEAFAVANDCVVVEGPWDGVAAQPVAYVGIAENGERVKLAAIAKAWRYSPLIGAYRPEGATEDVQMRLLHPPGKVVIQHIWLGRPIEGMVVGRAGGKAPVQSHGVIDGKDYYFRSRGEHWSMTIRDVEINTKLDWYYEEPYGSWPDAGGISAEQAYDFIAEAAAKFRAGVPTMTVRTIDKGTQSILDAIQQLQPE